MNSLLSLIFIAFIFSLILSTSLIKLILRIAFKNSLFDNHEKRKIHTGDVPRLGGVGIFLSVMITMLLTASIAFAILPNDVTDVFKSDVSAFLLVICALLILFAFGLADDLKDLRYRTKFIAQIISGILLCLCDIRITSLYGLMGINALTPWMSWAITIFAVLLIINALNFIDGIDGLAGSLSVLCLLEYCIVSVFIGNDITLLTSVVTIGAILPYLYFNLRGKAEEKNKIFMGDTGSMVLGFIISAIGIYIYEALGAADTRIEPLVAGFAPLVVPCFDVVRVVFVRIYERRSAFLADNSHIHHQLLAITGSQGETLCYLLLISATITILCYLFAFYFNINLVFTFTALVWVATMLTISRLKLKRNNDEN